MFVHSSCICLLVVVVFVCSARAEAFLCKKLHDLIHKVIRVVFVVKSHLDDLLKHLFKQRKWRCLLFVLSLRLRFSYVGVAIVKLTMFKVRTR
jgi:hypothetical protein